MPMVHLASVSLEVALCGFIKLTSCRDLLIPLVLDKYALMADTTHRHLSSGNAVSCTVDSGSQYDST